MAAAASATPKAELQRWCDRRFGQPARLQYECEAEGVPPAFRCTCILPDGRRFDGKQARSTKRAAEHDAAKTALREVSRNDVELDRAETAGTASDAEARFQKLHQQLQDTFSDESLLTHLPLREHALAAARRGDRHCMLPLAVLAAFDNKLLTACKAVDPACEGDPVGLLVLLLKAAQMVPSLRLCTDNGLWLGRAEACSQELLDALHDDNTAQHHDLQDFNYPHSMIKGKTGSGYLEEDKDPPVIDAVMVLCSLAQPARILRLPLPRNPYYLDEVAKALACKNAGCVHISRLAGKSSSTLRFYSPLPASSGDFTRKQYEQMKLARDAEASAASRYGDPCITLNKRATWLAGRCISGDTILMGAVAPWRYQNSSVEVISLARYQELSYLRSPLGAYQKSTSAPIACLLPIHFASVKRWHGKLPKSLLSEYIEQHKYESPGSIPGTDYRFFPVQACQKHCGEILCTDAMEGYAVEKGVSALGPFTCQLTVITNYGELKAASTHSYGTQSDAAHSAALAVLHLLQKAYEADLQAASGAIDTSCSPLTRSASLASEEASLAPEEAPVVDVERPSAASADIAQHGDCMKRSERHMQQEVNNHSEGATSWSAHNADSQSQDGSTSDTRSCGSFVTIMYTIWTTCSGDEALAKLCSALPGVPSSSGPDSDLIILEQHQEFSFELGSRAVPEPLGNCIAMMEVGQTARLPLHISYPAAANEQGKFEVMCEVKLLSSEHPAEKRLESAVFNPSLAKQRIQYALKFIKDTGAKTMVDLGCGAGALLEPMLFVQPQLSFIAGLLTRGAEKLAGDFGNCEKETKAPQILLCEGNLAEPDKRLVGLDVATCIEVIEHLDKDVMTVVEDALLGGFKPKILLLSTPNIEYNPLILSSTQTAPVGGERPALAPSSYKDCPLRNEDHRFEWTRDEFQEWAQSLAKKHAYSVRFDGVGELPGGPGYASQIAIFSALTPKQATQDQQSKATSTGGLVIEVDTDDKEPAGGVRYNVVWQWPQGLT
eukprot:SM000207S06162  [mRNA]  locus=s207:41674:47561:+ [translate_table: standard]